MKNYEIKKGKHVQLIHIDAYRLDLSKELLNLGWNDLISDPKNLILIEWPEKVAELIPKNAQKILLNHIDENNREIIF